MAERKPLVIIDGKIGQIPDGDTVYGATGLAPVTFELNGVKAGESIVLQNLPNHVDVYKKDTSSSESYNALLFRDEEVAKTTYTFINGNITTINSETKSDNAKSNGTIEYYEVDFTDISQIALIHSIILLGT